MLKSILALLLILFFTTSVVSQNISLMTYNVRYGLADDGKNSWEQRKVFLASQINFYNPDIFGTQEGLPFQIEFINSQLPNHSFIGKSRDADGKGEYSAIFYNHRKFEVLKQVTFWLSQTPLTPSKGWDAAYPRICTYGLFKDKETSNKFWVINTHFDHVGKIAREKSAQMILKKIKEINTKNYPLIFMGDLNAEPDNNPILILNSELNDSKEISIEKPFGPTGTFNAFQFDKSVTKRIDYIFISKNNTIKVNKYAVLSDSKDLKYPSDHLPVYIELNLIKQTN
ncbi:MAG: endonuclease/exonuclease/phosphatase family protein [Flavobacteriaceae bacterium]|nr:endonuclease/exonuclease/phosphatase family protein [Flavobacteriaceae bacterium]